MRLIPILVCIALGFLFAIELRMSEIIFTPDLTYIRYGLITYISPKWDKWIVRDKSRVYPEEFHALNGKTVIGESGFPFPVFSDCILGGYRNGVMDRSLHDSCSKVLYGEKSILYNTIFWSVVFYFVWILILLVLKSFPWGKGRTGLSFPPEAAQ